MTPERTWQRYDNLMAEFIDSGLMDAKEQYTTLLEARPKPHVLNVYTINRVILVYTEKLKFLPVFEDFIEKWREEEYMTPTVRSEINRLQEQLVHLHQVLTNILSLAEELKKGTIEARLKLKKGTIRGKIKRVNRRGSS